MFFERGANLESRAAHSHPKNTQVLPPGLYAQSLYIYLFFLYRVNQCRVQLGTNKVVVVVVVVAAGIHYYSTERDVTHMDDYLFSIFPPIFEKVVNWRSGSFEFYLLVRVISS